MKLKFTKMHGAGNDFVVLDGYTKPLNLSATQVRALANRHFGVGADQLLLVEKPTIDGVDFKYRIFNCDGGEVEHCGNGARCFVKFVRDRGLTGAASVRVQVQQGVITLTMLENGDVVVDMGSPVLRSPNAFRSTRKGSKAARKAPIRSGRSTSTERRSGFRRSRWAIRMRCRSSMMSRPIRSCRRGR